MVVWTADNQSKMATEGGIDMLIDLLGSSNEHVQRQAAKALANLGVNGEESLRQIVSASPNAVVGSGQQGTDRQGRWHQASHRARELQADRRGGRGDRRACQSRRQRCADRSFART